MKKLITILLLILCTFSVYAQNNVFILVDVSKSVYQNELSSAKKLVTDVITGQSSNFTDFSTTSSIPSFNFSTGGSLTIIHFGDKSTVSNSNPTVHRIKNESEALSVINNEFRTNPTDNRTYLTFAIAKCAELALNNNIKDYRMILISDNVSDDFGGSITNYSPNEQKLVNMYNTLASIYPEAQFIFKSRNAFTVLFKRIKLDKVISDSDGDGVDDIIDLCPNTPKGIKVNQFGCPEQDTVNAAITLTSPPKAKKGKEYEIKSETLNINWTCMNCPQGIKYTVSVSQYDGGKFKDTKKDLTANTATFKLPDGKFRITVSASNYSASSDYTHITVSTGSYGWLIFLLILIAAGAVGYYFWNKKRQEKIDVFSTNKADDIFSKGNGGTTGNSSNSDYF